MRKLIPAWCLAGIQLFIALALLYLGHRTPSPPFDTPYVPTATLICGGINAPLVVIVRVAEIFIPNTWLNGGLSDFEFTKRELIFLAGVVILWWLVGRLMERYQQDNVENSRQFSIAVAAALFLFGGILLLWGGELIRVPGRWNNLYGPVVEGGLFLVWAFVLIFYSVRSLRAAYLLRTDTSQLRRG